MTLTIDRPALRTESTAVLDSMRQGFGFIFKHSTISFVILSMTAGMFAMRCFGALLSIYVRDVLHSTSAVFGMLNTLIGIGMIVGTQLLTRFARHIPQQNLVVDGLGGMGIAVLTTVAFGTMGSTAAGMLGLGLCASAIFITATTLIQHETPAMARSASAQRGAAFCFGSARCDGTGATRCCAPGIQQRVPAASSL